MSTARLTYSPGEVAETTGLSIETVRRLIAKRDLPAKRVGTRQIVRHVDLEAFLDALPDAGAKS